MMADAFISTANIPTSFYFLKKPGMYETPDETSGTKDCGGFEKVVGWGVDGFFGGWGQR